MSSGRNRASIFFIRSATAPRHISIRKTHAAKSMLPGTRSARASSTRPPRRPEDNRCRQCRALRQITRASRCSEGAHDTDSAHSQRSTRSTFKVRALASKGIRSRKTVRLQHRTNRPVTNSSKPALSRLHRAPEDALVCSDLALLEPRWPRGPTAVFLEREAGR